MARAEELRALEPASGAVISDCGLYRYRLWRRWGAGPTCVFIMLNPSTADAKQDDPTIRRCIGFAKREGCGGLVVANLFAYRATSPKDMKAASDPVGPKNDEHLRWCADLATGPVIAGWGTHGSFMGRAAVVRRMLSGRISHLGLTAAGEPRHPLYLKGDAILRALAAEKEGESDAP
ncbi:DUF1643 domain-containing protein [Albimonas pacifica]|uniref:DUF1643 domain-containing protein n=1 Tax=Albimonas pacifica TaxID=1114924 RepID=A0A1I3FVK8_9RHOB|nr:DUF1643 domain-containing protein [Albimonas pacifica]SFI15082.1 hypothetical protein SAMN05216258_104537 [Albimonas pacifica]